MARVIFPAENARFDYRAAREFGDPVFAMNTFKISPMKTQELLEFFVEFLDDIDYSPTEDFIALTGNVVNLVVLTLAATRFGPNVKLLIFDAANERYIRKAV